MELRHLRYFVAVAEEEHITRAAERLGIQQPPLSQQIRALETELEVQLLRRKPRGVELTDAGRALLRDAREILDLTATAVARAQRTARGEQGSIVIGFTSSILFHPTIPGVIRAFRAEHPHVSLSLEQGGTNDLVDAVRSERMDAAFIRSPVADSTGLAIHSLLSEKMIVALPGDHRLARHAGNARDAGLSLKRLGKEPFVLYRRATGPGLYDAIMSACYRAGFNPDIVQEAPRIVSTLNLVAAGLGVTLVPASLRQLQMPGIAYRPLNNRSGLNAPINLTCRAVDHSEAAKRFVALVRRLAA